MADRSVENNHKSIIDQGYVIGHRSFTFGVKKKNTIYEPPPGTELTGFGIHVNDPNQQRKCRQRTEVH